jgi:hypothetical protein
VYQASNNNRKNYDFASIFSSRLGMRRFRSPLPKAADPFSRFAALNRAKTMLWQSSQPMVAWAAAPGGC